jgi:hypothetical protein
MNPLLQLLPYALFTAFALASTGYYLLRSSQQRLARRGVPSRVEPIPAARPTSDKPAWAATAAPAATPGKTQVLRLHELGITQAHIASALQIPLQEVQIVIGLDRARKRRRTPAEIPQPTIVE